MTPGEARALLPPEVVLFDVDGTLLDTREFILASFEHALSAAGLAVPAREDLVPRIGLPLEGIYAGLAGEAMAARLTEAHRSFQEHHLELATAFPGVDDVLGRLAEAGIVVAAVTTRSRRTSVSTLELAGIAKYFAAIVSAEDAPAMKPDPAPLLLALARSHAAGMRTAMVGDTAHDVTAGKRIGAFTVAALYGIGPAGALAAGPDAAIEDITGLPGALGL